MCAILYFVPFPLSLSLTYTALQCLTKPSEETKTLKIETNIAMELSNELWRGL